VDAKYGDQKIDISDVKEDLHEIHQMPAINDGDPSRP
jgi:hypothetical protein